MPNESYPVTVYSAGIVTSEGYDSYNEVLEQGGNDQIYATAGGVVAETSMGAGTYLFAESGTIVSGININDEGAVFSGTEVYCAGAEKWYGPVACATYGSIVLVGGTFTENRAFTDGGYLGQGGALEGYEGCISVSGGLYSCNSATGGGGAILAIGGTTEIADAEFSGNGATYGGAVEISQEGATATIANAMFTGNSAGYGGAVEIHQGASALIAGAEFTGNEATSGGAVMVDNYAAQKSFLTIEGGILSGNTAEQGGAILNEGELVVNYGDFIDNTAEDGKGGAIHNTGSATLSDAGFAGNAAIYGGAIWQGSKKLTLNNAFFGSNTGIYGGALYANGSGSTIVSGGSFAGNSAPYDEDYELGGMGGAIYVTAPATVTVTNAVFESNFAGVNPDDEWDGGCGGAVINYGNFSVTSGAFVSNSAYYGGGLYNQAGAGTPMTVVDVDFEKNSATYGGGAICNCWGELVVSGGDFYRNQVQIRDGGAIANWSVADISGATFFENSAVKGGALSHTGDTITVTDAVFGNNTAEEGGAFWNMNEWGDSVATLTNCSFTDNTAEAGGAVWNGETLTVSGGEFSNNAALDGKGGALYNSGAAVVSGANFVENGAVYGGAIWHGGETLEIADAYVANNTAIYGGAIYAAGSGATVISAASFEENRANYDEDYELGGMGGALYVTAAATVTVTDAVFEGNVAEVNPDNEWDGGCGGAVINYGNFTVSDSFFMDNAAYYGAGLYNQAGAGTPMTVENTNFSGNSATYGGGAICNCWGDLVVTGGEFTSNTAETSDGGAIANWSVATVEGAKFSGNTAVSGGAISNSWAQSITITDCTFSGNSATNGGAFIQMNGGVATVDGCSFGGNSATGAGGAIWNDGTLNLGNCEFTTATDTIYNAGTINLFGWTTFKAAVTNDENGVFTVALGDDELADGHVKGWSFLSGGSFGVSVTSDAAEGEYFFAEGVGTWSGDIALSVAGEASGKAFKVVEGTVTVDTIEYGGRTYVLSGEYDELALTVSGEPPTPALAAGDLNGDGRADIVMTISQEGHAADGSTGAWLIQENQTAAWGDLSQRNEGWEIFGTGVTTAGKTTCDVYVKSEGNVVGAWVTNDVGAVTGWETVGEFDASTNVLGLGDFNGDGKTDLLLRNDNGAVGCYLTDGTGWNYFQSLGEEWSICAVGDLNGDGRDDVVLKHDAGFAGSWLTQSDCTMAWADLDTLQEGFEIVGTGDFDGDGTSDVLLKNGGYYGAWIVEDGNAKDWMGLGDLGSVTIEQIADFDADGIDDLRIRTTAGDLGTQLVKGADTLDWKYYGSVGAEWSTTLAAI